MHAADGSPSKCAGSCVILALLNKHASQGNIGMTCSDAAEPSCLIWDAGLTMHAPLVFELYMECSWAKSEMRATVSGTTSV